MIVSFIYPILCFPQLTNLALENTQLAAPCSPAGHTQVTGVSRDKGTTSPTPAYKRGSQCPSITEQSCAGFQSPALGSVIPCMTRRLYPPMVVNCSVYTTVGSHNGAGTLSDGSARNQRDLPGHLRETESVVLEEGSDQMTILRIKGVYRKRSRSPDKTSQDRFQPKRRKAAATGELSYADPSPQPRSLVREASVTREAGTGVFWPRC